MTSRSLISSKESHLGYLYMVIDALNTLLDLFASDDERTLARFNVKRTLDDGSRTTVTGDAEQIKELRNIRGRLQRIALEWEGHLRELEDTASQSEGQE